MPLAAKFMIDSGSVYCGASKVLVAFRAARSFAFNNLLVSASLSSMASKSLLTVVPTLLPRKPAVISTGLINGLSVPAMRWVNRPPLKLLVTV